MEDDLIQRAADFAKRKHSGQKRDDGKDYFEAHLQAVADILRVVTENQELIAAAYLHDTIEDTETTYEELVDEFGEQVADLVMEVTQEGRADSYGYYFPRVKTKEGIMLKFADRLANISDIDSWHPKRQEQYLRNSRFWRDGSERP